MPPQLWTSAVVISLALLGLAVGRLSGRLVPLFGPARPDARTAANTHSSGLGSSGRDGPAAALPGPGGCDAVCDREDDDEGPPPPRCPHCRAELVFLRRLPAVAARAFHRRGTCPHCEQAVRSHPAVSAITALLFAAVGLAAVRQPEWDVFGTLACLWLAAVGAVLSVVDVRVMRLPDAVVAPSYPVAALLLAGSVLLPPGGPDPGRGADALVAMVLVTLLYWLLWRVQPGGLGFGDVKLSGLTGLYAGWAAGPVGALVSVFWAFAAFSAVGLVLLALRRLTRRDPFPLGPFMLAATLATVLAGQPLLP